MKMIILSICTLIATPAIAIDKPNDLVFHEKEGDGQCMLATQGDDGAIIFTHKPGAGDARAVFGRSESTGIPMGRVF